MKAPVVDRLVARLQIGPECWLWTGATQPSGYGIIRISGKNEYVHRVAYTLFVGPIPDGMTLDHLCRVRNCANPAHLEPVTSRENNLRGESPFAKNARATHCIHGHEFSGANTYVRPNGSRACRVCLRDRGRRHDIKRRSST